MIKLWVLRAGSGEFAPSAERWILLALGTGFAQLFRSSLEQTTGAVYIFAGLVLLLGRITHHRATAVAGYGALTAAFTARAISSWTIAESHPWHLDLIIVLAWGILAHGTSVWFWRLTNEGYE